MFSGCGFLRCKESAQLRLRRTKFIVAILLSLNSIVEAGATPADVDDISFDPDFLVGGVGAHVDISRFSRPDVILPGTYHVDIYVQNGWSGSQDVTFRALPGRDNALPCFDEKILTQMGVDWSKIEQAKDADGKPLNALEKLSSGPVCGDLGTLIPQASAVYDSSNLTLTVSIPQIYLQNHVSGWVDPSRWDYGVGAATLAYDVNSYTQRDHGHSQTDVFSTLTAGVNLGGWRFRHTGALQYSEGQGVRYQATSSYLQHDMTAARAQLTLGDSYTDGDMFDSMAFRGARIASDDSMLPDSQRGFAPIIRGMANSNAKITVSQHGVEIYQTSVAPGPFEIKDLYPNGYAGDLLVTITESDGTVRTFTVPYASTPQALRPGIFRYSVAVGQLRQTGIEHKPSVIQATWRQGFSNFLTGYSGLTMASGYGSGLLGAALNTRWGAISIDVTAARTHIHDQGVAQGSSFRLGYSKLLNNLGTQVSLATYRYSTAGYLSFNDATIARAMAQKGDDTLVRRRGQFDVNLSQPLGASGGSFYVNGSAIQYWHGVGNNVTFSSGYSNHFRAVTYTFSVQRTRDLYSSDDYLFIRNKIYTQWMFTLSVPLGRGGHSAYLNSSLRQDNDGGGSAQASLTGNLGEQNQFSYGATASRQDGQQGDSYSINGQYFGSKGIAGANYGRSSGSSQFGLSASGGIVLHAGGVTLAQQLTDTIGVVHVPGAKGAVVEGSGNNVRIDGRGYAIVSYLEPYHLDNVSIDPKGLPFNVELKDTTENVAPRSGAVVRLDFRTKTGYAALIDGTFRGSPLPFGADVQDVRGNSVGAVGQGGRVVAYGLPARGTLKVIWGPKPQQSCVIDYALPVSKKNAVNFEHLNSKCLDADAEFNSVSTTE